MCQMSAQTEGIWPRGLAVEKKRRVEARRRELFVLVTPGGLCTLYPALTDGLLIYLNDMSILLFCVPQ